MTALTQAPDAENMNMDTVSVPREPTEAMLEGARDWSAKLYGKPIGSDAARGCYAAMLSTAPTPQAVTVDDAAVERGEEAGFQYMRKHLMDRNYDPKDAIRAILTAAFPQRREE